MNRKCIVLAVTFCLAAPAASFADYAAAEKAVLQQDYAAARKELASLSRGTDARVFRMLAELDRDGKGSPADFVEAYKDFSLEGMYTNDPDERAEAFGLRRQVARKLVTNKILEAEERVKQAVISRLGKEEAERQVDRIRAALASCKSECEAHAVQVFALGPVAIRTAPELESLMIRDPMWMPREAYAYALAYLGTVGVPALARQLGDEKELATEGFWNLRQSAAALGSLGPTAFAARPPLLTALTRSYEGLGGQYNEFDSTISGASPDETLFSVQVALMQALVNISDPQREIHDDLRRYLQAASKPAVKLLVGWGVGLLYQEVDPGLDLAATALSGTDLDAQRMALVVIGDFNSMPAARERVDALVPAIRKITTAGKSEASGVASSVLDVIAHPSIEAASKHMEKREFVEAIAASDAALAINPVSEQSLRIRAEARRETGDLEGAVKDFSLALETSDFPIWAQWALKDAGLIQGEITAGVDDATRDALRKCVHDDKCYAKLKQFN